MNALELLAPRPKPRWMALVVSYFLGMTAIVGWSLPAADLASHRADPATRLPDGEVPDTARERQAPVEATRYARNKVNCDGCGVIELVRRIDTREEIMEWCAIGDTAGTRLLGNLNGGGGRDDQATFADMVAGVIVGEHRAKRVRVTTRHQIVVRFRDGSRHVFNEDSPRTLREGDRIKVIAGATGVNG